VHITDDVEAGQRLRDEWEATGAGRAAGDHRFALPLVRGAGDSSYIDALDRSEPGQYVTVVLPEFRTAWPWQRVSCTTSQRGG